MDAMVQNLLATIHHSGRLPHQAVVNLGIRIGNKQLSQDKASQVCGQGRNIHCYPPFTQSVLRAVRMLSRRPQIPYWSFGAIPRRQREEAIMIQQQKHLQM